MIIIDKLTNNSDINTIILDIDGTITRWKDVKLFLEKSLNILGAPYNDEALIGLFQAMKDREYHAITTGESDEEIYSMLLEKYIKVLHEYGISGKNLKDTMFELEASETYISEKVPEEIQELTDNNYKLYAYSNWFRKQSLKKLDRYDLTKYFSAVHSSEDSYIKYSKIGFLWLLQKYHLDPARTVHIGDSSTDVIPSHKAGMHSIYLDYDINSLDDITKEKMNLILTADASITEFEDIRRILMKK